MAVFKCKMCGGALEINAGNSVAVCEYCNTKQTLPKLDDDKRAQLYDRANYFRRENEFDKAMGIYEMILSEDKEDCESYWGIVLCRYGIEYVEDPRSHKRIPTVNRAQFTSIFEDEDYKNAIRYADALQKEVYEAEASVIDKIQKGILAISQKEEPFDVFICYKETDSFGNRTQDSVYAQDIYNALTKEGYKVFFSRITLEDKLGSAYEPYIFAALNSAKVMLVVGTSKENFEAVWVKNEWSRFVSLIKSGKEKTLIPVYKDISPYDMPEEFQFLQAQDMSKIGFMQDLVRGVSKIIGQYNIVKTQYVPVQKKEIKVAPPAKTSNLLKPKSGWVIGAIVCIVFSLVVISLATLSFFGNSHANNVEVETETIAESIDSSEIGQEGVSEYDIENSYSIYTPNQPVTTQTVQSTVYAPGTYTVDIAQNESVVLRASYEYGSAIIKKNNKSIRVQSGTSVYAYETAIIKDPETGKYALKGRINYDGYDGWCFIKWVNSVDRVAENQPGIVYTVPPETTQSTPVVQNNGVMYTVDTLDNSSVRFSESYEWGAKILYDGTQAIFIPDGTELLVYETVEIEEKGGGVALKGKTTYKGQTGWCFLYWIEPPPET